ncbi:MAG: PilZ domain-containing protein [Desulfobacterales bacterium]|nr:PilZ domain-containing protein [Desulfobacterales bacterium]MBF0397726.1 PilZ domain-containing protein [Desulfobacterales bacterium]
MKKKPIPILIISIIYMLLPLWYYGQTAYYYAPPFILKNSGFFSLDVFFNFLNVISKYTLSTYIISISTVIVGIGIFMVKRWSLYFFYLHAMGIVIWNFYLAKFDLGQSFILLLTLSVLQFAITIIFISKTLREPYFNPRIRWWKQDKRFYVDIPAALKYPDKEKILEGKVKDISDSGIFWAGDLEGTDGQIVEINISHKDLLNLSLTGEIVWLTEGNKSHPKGAGIKFINMDKDKKKNIKKIIEPIRIR